MVELYDRGAWYIVSQRIKELEKWLERFPQSEFYQKRKTELETAKVQLERILSGKYTLEDYEKDKNNN